VPPSSDVNFLSLPTMGELSCDGFLTFFQACYMLTLSVTHCVTSSGSQEGRHHVKAGIELGQ